MEQNTNNRQPSPPKKSARPKITVFSPLPGQEKNESADPTKETIDSAILTDDSASVTEPPAEEEIAESGDTAEEAPAAPEASTFNVGLTVTRRTLSGEDTKKEKPQDQKKTDPPKREKRAVTEKKDEPKKKRLRVVHGAPPRKTDNGAETEHVFLRMAKKLRIGGSPLRVTRRVATESYPCQIHSNISGSKEGGSCRSTSIITT